MVFEKAKKDSSRIRILLIKIVTHPQNNEWMFPISKGDFSH